MKTPIFRRMFASRATSPPGRLDGDECGACLSARLQFQSCLLLAAIPIVLSAINSGWLYTPLSWLDPWYNVAYFLHYGDPTFLNSYYKSSRLSWIIPGFVAYKIFQPIVANYILHMGCLVVSVLFFYLTVIRLFGHAIAFATAACLAVFIPFHGSGGWDYQNAAGGAYYIVAFYFLSGAPSSRNRKVLLVGSGVAYAAAIHAVVSFVNAIPILGVQFLVLYYHQFGERPSWPTILLSSLWFLTGAIALTIALGLVNVTLGRDFLFFWPLIEIVFSYVHDSHNLTRWWLPWSTGWFLEPNTFFYYIRFIFAVLVACLASVVGAIVQRRFCFVALSLQAQYIFIVVLWIAWQTVGQTALQPEYFAYPLYPAMFFALAGLAATWKPTVKSGATPFLFCALIAVVAATSLSGLVDAASFSWVGRHTFLALAASAVVSIGLFAVSMGRRILIAAAVLAFLASNQTGGAVTGGTNLYAFHSRCNNEASGFAALIDADRFMTRDEPDPQKIYIWWDKNELLHDHDGCVFSLAGFSLSMGSFGEQYLAPLSQEGGPPGPEKLTAESISMITDSSKIAVATANSANVERIVARFRQAGVNLVVEGRMIIPVGDFAFDLYVLGRTGGM